SRPATPVRAPSLVRDRTAFPDSAGGAHRLARPSGGPGEPPAFPPRRSSDLGALTDACFPVFSAMPKLRYLLLDGNAAINGSGLRSQEHTPELQSRCDLVCRLVLPRETPGPCSPPA